MSTPAIARTRLASAVFVLGILIATLGRSSPAQATCPGPLFFSPATSVVTAWNPTYIATGDFNGDGKVDLVVANSFREITYGLGSSIAVLLGHGDGSFDAPVYYACGNEPRSIATGDFNGDGITDLAVANQGGTYVSVLLGLGSAGVGNGAFAAEVRYAAGAGPFHIRAADLNADGITDLVVSNNSAAAVSVLLGRGTGGVGDGTFAAPVGYPLNNLSTGLALADLDADGILDIVATENYSGTIAILFGRGLGGVGDGTFRAAVHVAAGLEPFDITVRDLDGDGIRDLIVANTGGGGVVFLRGNGSGGMGNGTFAPPTVLASGNTAQAAFADVDQDGITDLIATVAAAPGRITVYRGQGTGLASAAEFAQPSDYPVGGDPVQTAITDLNDDGRPDIAVPDYYDDFISTLLGACTQDPRSPVLTRVRDVPNDQGRKVFVTWTRSSLDVPGGAVNQYRVWRRIPPELALGLARAHGTAPLLRIARVADGVQGTTIEYWEAAATLPAQRLPGYGYTATTSQDSMRHSNPYTAFFITALTNDIDVFYSSNVDSGYSVDNIPPHGPGHFAGQVIADGSVVLRWDAVTDPDLSGYRVYRGTSQDFIPLPANLIASPSDTALSVPNGSAFVYKLTAVDQNENESPSATWTLTGPVGVDGPDLAFALQGALPNPSRDGSLVIRFSLPGGGAAQLTATDVTGRVVASRWITGAGAHAVELAPAGRLPAGIYLVRLAWGDRTLRAKAVVFK